MHTNKRKICSLFFVFVFLTQVLSQTPPAPVVYDVSGEREIIAPPTGSLEGGKDIFIHGANFGTDVSKISVTVGPYPCDLLADGSTDTFLSCRTTKASDPA
jgi:hypothetical protein